ncbi:glycosyl transferase family A [Luteitalea sp. TBR-22]|uniref:glycosyltransferase family 2 protein n=1 Tax=Luteitalea sp. TBR-22 TaxID=2802971 RepID=UPI001AF987F2|nr:glycosyltransferase family 2 protein [Luteitalea sp. TBR-22]BCS36071.1 glycosyl transferase family A [Luteitalea sp. TBR-22]
MSDLSYALVTPARNEADYIGKTLESVARQTVLPVRWVIVSDGSTDATERLVAEYAASAPFIELVCLSQDRSRDFAAKVQAFNAGLARLSAVRYDVIGSLDADISFGPDYFEFLLKKFSDSPRLGVAGTPFAEGGATYDYRYTNQNHVSGACQLFRRECFEEIGGYVPIPGGGIDWVAVTTARMKGWQTRTFTERISIHHRPMGTGASQGKVRALFRHGQKDFALGGHPAWQLFRGAYQMTRRPHLVGGAALLTGYFWALLSGKRRVVSPELARFNRSEQMARLRSALVRRTA